MSKKWRTTENHWTNKPKSERKEIIRKISTGWGKKPKTGKWLTCGICGKKFYRKKCHLERSKSHYCSPECHTKSKKGEIPKNIEIARKNSPIKPGKDNINWRGGTSSYPSKWTWKLKHEVLARDNNKCQVCGTEVDLVIHHVDFNKESCSLENLISLCRSCHTKEHWRVNNGASKLEKCCIN